MPAPNPRPSNALTGLPPLNPLTAAPEPASEAAPSIEANPLTGGEVPLTGNALTATVGDKALARRVARVEEALGHGLQSAVKFNPLTNAIEIANLIPDTVKGSVFAARHPEIMPGTPGALSRAFKAGKAELTMAPEGQLNISGGRALEDLGVPELGHVSTLLPFLYTETGQGWRPKRGGIVDFTGRDAAGIAADAVVDPLTYSSFGLKPAVGVVREGGRVKGVLPSVTRAGKEALAEAVKAEAPQALAYAKWLAAHAPTASPVRKAEVEAAARAIAAEAAVAKVAAKVEAGATHLVDTSTMRFAGQPLTKAAPLTAALNTNWGAKAMRATPVRLLDKAFNETLYAGRRIPGVEEAKSALRADRRVLASRVAKALRPALGKWTKEPLAKPFDFFGQPVRTMGEYAMLHLDDPARFPVDPLSPRARVGVDELRLVGPEMFADEVANDAIPAQAFRQNYAPHQFLNKAEDLRDLSTNWTKIAGEAFDSSFNVGPHGEVRVFPTFTDAMEFANKLRQEGVVKWQLKPNLDIRRAWANRAATHVESQAAARFERRMITNYGLGKTEVADEVFRRMHPAVRPMIEAEIRQNLPGVRREAGQIATGQTRPGGRPLPRYADLGDAAKAIADAWAGKAPKGGVVRRLSPTAKAAYYQARVGAARNMDEFLRFLNRAQKEVGQISPDALNNLRELKESGYRRYLSAFGEPYKRLTSGPFAGYYLPQAAADEVTRVGTGLTDLAEVKGMLKVKDAIDDAFKFGVTIPFPAFTARNVISDNAEVLLDLGLAAANPRRNLATAAIAAGRDGTLPTPLGRRTYEEIRTLFRDLGLETPAGSIHDFVSASGRPLARVTTNKVSNFFRKIYRTEQLQDLSKMQLFVTYLERGLLPEAAAERVHSTVFDYQKLTKFERQWLRRLWPIQYTWASKNIRKVADTLVRNPGRISAMLRLGDRDTGPEQDALPQYLQGDFRVKVEQDGRAVHFRGLDLPTSSAIETSLGTPGRNAILTNLAGLSPTIKTLVELGTKRELYTGKDIREAFRLDGLAADVVRAQRPQIQEWLEWDDDQQTVNGLKFYLIVKATPLSRAMSSAQQFKKDRLAPAIIQFLTGFGYKEFALDQMQERALYNNVKAAEEEARLKGKYQTILVPKAEPKTTNPLLQ